MLSGEVELDGAYIGAKVAGRVGRGTGRQPFVVAVERGRGGCVVRAVENLNGGTYEQFAHEHICRASHVRADAFPGISAGLARWPGLDQHAFDEADGEASLPVVHHIISNVKSQVLGTHHGVTRAWVQSYFDEFSWRYTHRHDPDVVESLLGELLSPGAPRGALVLAFAQQPGGWSGRERGHRRRDRERAA